MLAAVLAAAALLTAPAAVSAGGAVSHFVDDDQEVGASGCDGTGQSVPDDVQEAVDAAGADDTILVCPGDYAGQVVVDGVDGLTIRGVDPWTATLMPTPLPGVCRDATGSRDRPRHAGRPHRQGPELRRGDRGVSRTTIKWLRFTTGSEGTCLASFALIVAVQAPESKIRANHLDGGGCRYFNGIMVDDSAGSVIAWNRVIDFLDIGIVAGGIR